jgi:hypothetical protein
LCISKSRVSRTVLNRYTTHQQGCSAQVHHASVGLFHRYTTYQLDWSAQVHHASAGLVCTGTPRISRMVLHRYTMHQPDYSAQVLHALSKLFCIAISRISQTILSSYTPYQLDPSAQLQCCRPCTSSTVLRRYIGNQRDCSVQLPPPSHCSAQVHSVSQAVLHMSIAHQPDCSGQVHPASARCSAQGFRTSARTFCTGSPSISPFILHEYIYCSAQNVLHRYIALQPDCTGIPRISASVRSFCPARLFFTATLIISQTSVQVHLTSAKIFFTCPLHISQTVLYMYT